MMSRMVKRDDPETIGRRVQRLRRERGLTQRQLAEPAYTPAYVSTLEAGRGDRQRETAAGLEVVHCASISTEGVDKWADGALLHARIAGDHSALGGLRRLHEGAD